ncbi:MAG: hypothetical protein RBR54_03280 [Sulfurimonas sp.]|jgi:hypothetical protein|nr:hypothetical protein [Sulfurimonas sp.]
MRLTIDEYSKHFKMSKEMINSKLKMRKLNYIIENGTTYIIVTRSSIDMQKRQEIHQEKKASSQTTQSEIMPKPKPTVAMILALYQRENRQLKDKIMELEAKVDKLINDKEQMLRDERDKIEQVYSAKDEQLKNILELINKKMMLEQQGQAILDTEVYASDVETPKKTPQLIELREYLKTLDLKSYQRKIIKRRFTSVRDSDIRIMQQNGKIFLDFSKYDYSDLLAY